MLETVKMLNNDMLQRYGNIWAWVKEIGRNLIKWAQCELVCEYGLK